MENVVQYGCVQTLCTFHLATAHLHSGDGTPTMNPVPLLEIFSRPNILNMTPDHAKRRWIDSSIGYVIVIRNLCRHTRTLIHSLTEGLSSGPS